MVSRREYRRNISLWGYVVRLVHLLSWSTDFCVGEFSSPKQGTFYHYNDFWHLDPSSREWTRVETKGKGPPARSGHRMTYFKVS